jgi:hypothetical protein
MSGSSDAAQATKSVENQSRAALMEPRAPSPHLQIAISVHGPTGEKSDRMPPLGAGLKTGRTV